jgi:hypothetical protein
MQRNTFRHRVGAWLLAICGLMIGIEDAQVFAQSLKQTNRSGSITAPDWYDKVPPDSANLVARGKARSNDQQVAIDKAVAFARASLAKSIERKWADLLKAIQKESASRWQGKGESVTLIGSVPKMQKTVKRGRYYTAFVLVALPLESVHASLEQRLRSDMQWYSTVKDTKAVREFETDAH